MVLKHYLGRKALEWEGEENESIRNFIDGVRPGEQWFWCLPKPQIQVKFSTKLVSAIYIAPPMPFSCIPSMRVSFYSIPRFQ